MHPLLHHAIRKQYAWQPAMETEQHYIACCTNCLPSLYKDLLLLGLHIFLAPPPEFLIVFPKRFYKTSVVGSGEDEDSSFTLWTSCEACSQYCQMQLWALSCPPVCLEQLGSHWTYFHEIWNLSIYKNLSRKFNVHWNITRIMRTLHEDIRTFVVISEWILLKMKNVLDTSCRQNQNSLHSEQRFTRNHAMYETMRKKRVQPDRPRMAIW